MAHVRRGDLVVVTNMVGTGLFLLPSSLATIGSISIYGWVVSAIVDHAAFLAAILAGEDVHGVALADLHCDGHLQNLRC